MGISVNDVRYQNKVYGMYWYVCVCVCVCFFCIVKAFSMCNENEFRKPQLISTVGGIKYESTFHENDPTK